MTVVPGMSFRDWQPRYAAHGIATFPFALATTARCLPSGAGSVDGLPGSVKLGRKFANSDAFGFCPGRRSRLTILDVDTNDERTLVDAIDRHGPTPIIVRSGSGNHQAWYRWRDERRQIRPDPHKPIDILASGFVVAPPSHGIKSNYQFIQGGLDDLEHLPVLRDTETAPSLLRPESMPRKAVTEGNRNNTLWQHCMREAHYCDSFESLLDVARTRNSDFLPPLTDSEVVKITSSAWGYTQRGTTGSDAMAPS